MINGISSNLNRNDFKSYSKETTINEGGLFIENAKNT